MIRRPPFAAGATLRFVAFGGSISSDWRNPVATSARAVLAAIADLGHEMTYCEQRGNPALAELLAARGSRPFKAFTDHYRQIQYRTYDLPRGWERTVWFGREAGTADAIIALPGTPPELLREIAALPTPHIVRLVDESIPIEGADVRLIRAGLPPGEDMLLFGPAVRVTASHNVPRSERPIVVAYDDADEGRSVATELAGREPVLVVAGGADLPEWIFVPEVELPDWYGRHRVAIVTGTGADAWARARQLLPLGSGCASAAAPETAALADSPRLPEEFDARVQAEQLIQSVKTRLGR